MGKGWATLLGGVPALAAILGRARRSVRGKLMAVVLITTAIALGVAGSAMLTQDLRVYRQTWISDLSTQASILALSTAPALAFDDHQAAERDLAALQARPEVLAAALYDSGGALYASYLRGNAQALASTLSAPLTEPRISGESVELTRELVQHGERLGTIYLRARYDVTGRITAYLGIFAFVTVLSMLVALALSTALQKVITEPLGAMAGVARQIVERRDYSLRAQKTTRDEIGLVVEAFNSMLDEVQARARAAEQTNAALQAEVEVRQAAQAALARANARLESTMAAGEIGSWVWDFKTDEITVDRNLVALYGLENDDELRGSPELMRRRVHPDDLEVVLAAETAALRSGVLPSTEFRVVWPDGTIRWMASRGKVQFDANAAPISLSGLLIDITAQKIAEQALRESEKLYRAIGESIDYGVWVCDATGRIVYASESFLHLIGATQGQLSNAGWGDALHPDEAQATMAAWRECVRAGAFWYRELRVRGSDGRYHPILAQGVPIRSEGGQITGWAGINLDISRVKRTEDALREADRRKDEFLATLAHELRNPLAPIRYAIKLLQSPTAEERQRAWGRTVIGRQVERMALMLDDLLDVARITRGRLDLKKEPVELESLVTSAVETARPLIDEKKHKLEVELPRTHVLLDVDPLRLSQALSNLLTNAAKYTDAGGHIRLQVSLDEQEIVMAVRDTGIGLTGAAMPQLFEMFSQLDSAIDRAEGGLGIGLALVKGLIELHGGSVEALSAGLGQGSEFIIRLPRTVVIPGSVPSPQRVFTGGPVGGCKVLIADDNRDAADSLAMILKLSGYEVVLAYSGKEAITAALRERPEALILDIGMPDATGYEVAERLRQEPWGRSALLLAITGWGQEDDKKRAKAAGFDEHLTKPVDAGQVEQVLSAFLQQRTTSRTERDGTIKVAGHQSVG